MPTNKEITLAKYAGFCYGVKRAVDTVKKLKLENPDKEICILGELIHNSQVIEDLSSCGIDTIEDLPEQGEGICVVRTHGQSPETFEKIESQLWDLTRIIDRFYYLPIEFNLIDDGVRNMSEDLRQGVDKVIREQLFKFGRTIELTGTLQDRLGRLNRTLWE